MSPDSLGNKGAETQSEPKIPRFWPLFGIAAAIRLVVVLAGLFLAPRGPSAPLDDPYAIRLQEHIMDGSAHVIEPWFRFDALWYVNVSENGYAGAEDSGGKLGVAFLPALPVCMMAAKAIGLNPFWAALVLVNLAAAAGSAVLARLAARLTSDYNTGLRTFALISAYPSSFFLSAPYNEAFGLLFGALALSAWQARRPVAAGAWAALGSLARMTGVTPGVAAMGAWLFNDRTRAGLVRALILAFGSFLGLALFWGYLQHEVGDAFAGLRVQEKWGRKPPSIENLWRSVESIRDPRIGVREGIIVFAVIALGIRSWWKRGPFWGLVTLVPVVQLMLSGTLLSANRLLLAALPAFIELADLLRNRIVFTSTVVFFSFEQLVLLNAFIHRSFVG